MDDTSLKALGDRLDVAAERFARLQQAHADYARYDEQAMAGLESCNEAAEALEREEREWTRLQKTSLHTVLHTLTGNIDKQRVKERKEYEAARAHYDLIAASLETARSRREEATATIWELKDAASEYRALEAEWEQQLLQRGDERSAALREANAALATAAAKASELRQVYHTGDLAHSDLLSLQRMFANLHQIGRSDALGWDSANREKHSYLQEVGVQLDLVHRSIDKFAAAAIKVGISFRGQLRGEALSSFRDRYFDNVFSDLAFLSKVDSFREKIADLLERLQAKLEELRVRQEPLDAQEAAAAAVKAELLRR
ncbi:hypothetical protein [Flaviaesturariibacter amylovorans]|uniref:Uncharacterized protein n=1 Tax=Flaviaesturariibacter amylovorans TaxID=1084520 RepID=A0ABP8GEP7_9BACT